MPTDETREHTDRSTPTAHEPSSHPSPVLLGVMGIAAATLTAAISLTGCATTDPLIVEEAPRPEASIETTVTAVPLDEIELVLEPFADGLEQPLYITGTGEGIDRLIVLEKTGRAWEYADGVRSEKPFLDLSDAVSSDSERGLLGIAFPQGFAEGGRFYVNYTDTSGATVISRFTLGTDGMANRSSEVEVLSFDQPYSNHNGGMIEFGPDGMLYIGTGDGGSGGDPQGNGQRLDTYLGKLLRIDVEFEEGLHGVGDPDEIAYLTPSDNPFASDQALPEIWASGLRNPWRFSFDRGTGDLWIGDVGQNAWEEIDFQPADSSGGENYGWATLEGTHPYPPEADPGDTSGLVMPIVEYDRDAGESVTGGYVYRGDAYPALEGVYLYGDFESGRIWGLRRSRDEVENVLLLQTSHSIASFGEDDEGELYVVDLSGRIMKIAAAAR